LLGHNGAGKTTALNLLIGRHKPNEGTIVMENNLDIRKDLEAIRMRIGVC
jgi:ABC-type multidrug transport system ATPase subunit